MAKKYVFDDGFESDGCTGVPDWFVDCCVEHDRHYAVKDISRAEADKRFRQCLWNKGWRGKLLAWPRWFGVRLLGWWGY